MTEEIKPCPFCGHVGLHFEDGSTYRWGIASCGACGATGGEVRRNYPDDGKWHADAIREWNRREPSWQPIETAPKDGTLVLLCCVGWPHSVLRDEPWPIKVGGWWKSHWDIFGASWEPTHWMPLPEGPSTYPKD